MNKHTRYASARGFSLIELMIVLVIMGVLMSIVGFNLMGQASRAKEKATKMSMQTIIAAMRQYYVEFNGYPPAEGGLQALIDERFIEGYKDGWDREIRYFPNAEYGFELRSDGEDGRYGTVDDIMMYPDDGTAGTP